MDLEMVIVGITFCLVSTKALNGEVGHKIKRNAIRVAFLYERPFLSLHALEIRKV